MARRRPPDHLDPLLGSATLLQFTVPGVFPVNPFFFLIGLTYGLSVVYLSTLKYVERYPWLVNAQLWIDVVLVSAFILVTGGIRSDFSSLYLLPIIAATIIRSRSGGLQVAALSACGYFAIVASQYVSMEQFPLWVAREPDLPAARFAQYVAATNVCGFVGVALLAGSLAEGLRSADARLVDASAAMADLRAFNAHVIDSLVSGLVTADAEWRVLTFNRAASPSPACRPRRRSAATPARCWRCRRRFASGWHGAAASRGRRADFAYATADGRTIDLGVTAAPLHFPDGTAGPPVHVPGRDRREAAGARRRPPRAAGGGGGDGRRHRPRDPQSAGLDVRLDAGAARRAVAQRRAGRADGHRAARNRSG